MRHLYMVVTYDVQPVIEQRLQSNQIDSTKIADNAFLVMSELSSDRLAYTLFSKADELHSPAIHGLVCSAEDTFGFLPDSSHHWLASLANKKNSGIAQLNDYGPSWSPTERPIRSNELPA